MSGIAVAALIIAILALIILIALAIYVFVDRGNLLNDLAVKNVAVTFSSGSSTATASYTDSLANRALILTGTTQGSSTVTISLSLTNNVANTTGKVFYVVNNLQVGSGTPPSEIDLQIAANGSLTVNPTNLKIPFFGGNSSTTGGLGGNGRTAMFVFTSDNVAQFMGMSTSGLSS